MVEVISVRFRNKGKIYYFDPAGLDVPTNANVIVETAKGLEYAECTHGNHFVEETAIIPPLRPVVRIATEEDRKRAEENRIKEAQAFKFCEKKIEERKLDMKLVGVEYSFEGSKILFFFTADGRVDFRELVKDLAAMYKTRIELRQIGVRDEARMIGGLGICGKPFCCTQFLEEFHPVSIKMAKTQGLSLNPVKISGACGRLMCCLKYEESAYEELVKKAPKVDAFVDTPCGKGSVVSVNLLRGFAKVRLEDGLDTTLKTFSFDELNVLGGKARRAEYIAAKAEGRLEEAGFIETPRPSAPAPAAQAGQETTPEPVKSKVPEPPKAAIAEQAPSKKPEAAAKSERRRQKGRNALRAGAERKALSPEDNVPEADILEEGPPAIKMQKRRAKGKKGRMRPPQKRPADEKPPGGQPSAE